jgi:integrase
MSVSLKLYALARKKKKNGELPIYLRITKDQKYRYVSTGVSVEPKYWNESTCQVRKSHPRHARLNQDLVDFVESVRVKMSEMKNVPHTVYSVTEQITKRRKENFFSYAQNFAMRLAKEDNLFESRQMIVLINHLEGFLKTKNIEFEDFDLRKIMAFRDYMGEVKENGSNTINKKIKRLRRIFKNARREGVTSRDPFLDYESLPSVKSDKNRLTPEQMKAISELTLKKGSGLWHTRNAFLFSYYNAGIRFGDLCQLRWRNLIDNYLVYRMSKTDTVKKIKLTKPVLEILSLYKTDSTLEDNFIFPLLTDKNLTGLHLKRQISSKNVIANKNLKTLCQMANIQANVSFHVARHSFADYARQSSMSIYDISKALGHSNIRITEQYLASFDDHSLDKGMEGLFGKA